MKQFATRLLAILCFAVAASRGAAQSTAFTYQGYLTSQGAPANGSFDLQFAVFDAASGGGQQGVTVVSNSLGITNGLFTVTIDPGASVFTGSARWLNIGVRPAGGAAFTNVVPRQAITASPYAVFAGGVTAAGISGTLPASVLPASVITNGASGVSISGSFTGNGAGLTNLSDPALSGNVALLNRAQQNFTGTNTFAGRVGIGTTKTVSPLDIVAGADYNGEGDPGGIALQWSGGGYRHFISTRHVSAVNSFGNGIDFYLNSTNTAAGSSAPGVGNVKVMTVGGDGTVMATAFSGNGSGLTGLSDSGLSANVALLNRSSQNFTGTNTFAGRVGIGTFTPNFPLSFASQVGDKIGLYTQSGDHFGLGVQPGLLQIHTDTAGSAIAFGYGQSSAMTETMRIQGNRTVGIGTNNPASILDLFTTTSADGVRLTGAGVPVSYMLRNALGDGGLLGLAADAQQYSASALSNDVVLRATAGKLLLQSGAGAPAITIRTNNFVGIGTPDPATALDVNGTITATALQVNGSVAATAFTGDGAGLTGLADGSLSGNVALLNRSPQNFTGTNAFAGNVGIGTTTPNFPLSFADQAGDKIGLYTQSGNHFGLGIQAGLLQIYTDTFGSAIAFGYGQSSAMTETMRIQGDGKVGIGKTNPATALDVNGTVTATAFSGNGAGLTGLVDGALSANVALLNRSTQNFTGTNTFAGNVGIGTTTPASILDLSTTTSTDGVRLTGAGVPVSYMLRNALGEGGLLGLAAAVQQYSGSAASNDVVLRATAGKLLLQSGGGDAAITIPTNHFVGIGTPDPASVLHVNSLSDTEVSIQSTTTNGRRWTLQSSSGQAVGQLSASFQIIDRTQSASRILVDTNGNVGIGTTAPTAKLSVNGAANNTTGTWGVFSDRRLKENIAPMTAGSLEHLLALRGVTYDYNRPELREGYAGPHRGWIAQEVEQVFPEWVSETAEGTKMLTPVGFNALTVEALRELRAEKDASIQGLNQKMEVGSQESGVRMQKLEAENAELKKQNAAMEQRLGALEKFLNRLSTVQKGGGQ